jgi:hypothetical protein
MVRNESVRFGRLIDIEVSYELLWLKIPKLVLILHYLACFQKGLFGGNFEQKTLGHVVVKQVYSHCAVHIVVGPCTTLHSCRGILWTQSFSSSSWLNI